VKIIVLIGVILSCLSMAFNLGCGSGGGGGGGSTALDCLNKIIFLIPSWRRRNYSNG